jgi:osmotically-inducible protein OsmY
MFGREKVPDKTILKDVNKRLARTGMGARCRVTATIRGGQVTLSGQMQYENQRRPIVQAVNRAGGIRGVIDQMTVVSRETH